MQTVQQKVITVILSKGKAMQIAQALVEEHQLNQVDIHYARGVGRITPLRHRGIGETSEKEVLTVCVNAAKAEELFDYIYHKANINQPHGGLMYMQDQKYSTRFLLPDIAEEE